MALHQIFLIVALMIVGPEVGTAAVAVINVLNHRPNRLIDTDELSAGVARLLAGCHLRRWAAHDPHLPGN